MARYKAIAAIQRRQKALWGHVLLLFFTKSFQFPSIFLDKSREMI